MYLTLTGILVAGGLTTYVAAKLFHPPTAQKLEENARRLFTQASPREEYVHIRSGGRYVLLGHGEIEATNTPCVIYQSLANGKTWVRPSSEFFDGRFRPV